MVKVLKEKWLKKEWILIKEKIFFKILIFFQILHLISIILINKDYKTEIFQKTKYFEQKEKKIKLRYQTQKVRFSVIKRYPKIYKI